MTIIKRGLSLALALLLVCACLPRSIAAEAVTDVLEITEPIETVTEPREETAAPATDGALIEMQAAVQSPSFAAACGKELQYTLIDGVLTISGTGSMPSFKPTGAPWFKNAASITEVISDMGLL